MDNPIDRKKQINKPSQGDYTDSMPSKSQSQPQSRDDRSKAIRERILDGAYEVLVELGHAGLRSSNIAKAAGVSRGGMLHHYASKEQLIAALYVRLIDQFEEASWNIIDSTPDDQLVEGLLADTQQRFLSEAFLAALDILVASSEEKLIAESLDSSAPSDRIPAREGWAKRFEDAGVDKITANRITSLVWNAIKGLAIRNTVARDNEHCERVVALTRKLATEVYKDALKKGK